MEESRVLDFVWFKSEGVAIRLTHYVILHDSLHQTNMLRSPVIGRKESPNYILDFGVYLLSMKDIALSFTIGP